MLSDTPLRKGELALAYKATEDGWSALDFHRRCDYKGPCVVVARTQAGVVFGGFNPVGWMSADDYTSAWGAFLFSFPDSTGTPAALPKIGSSDAAVFDFARGGPQWGVDGLVIGPPQAPVMGGMAGPDSPTNGAGDVRTAKSRLGLSYAALPDGGTSLLGAGAATAVLAEVEAYYAPAIAAMY
ncbi:hypothetical protein WJX81_008453 [Elliptochloris bilobata]|uniref:TLDc domain-containing protein n=1 Tax=Elliptochloris bilobata TaxID=381761 RepID=A0AAW1S432_9CHLO